MLVTCNECEGEISETARVCPYCGYRGWSHGGGSAGYDSPEMVEGREKWHKEYEERKEKEEEKIRAAQLAEEQRRAEEERIRKQRRDDLVMTIVMVIVITGMVVGAAFGIRYLWLETVSNISKWF